MSRKQVLKSVLCRSESGLYDRLTVVGKADDTLNVLRSSGDSFIVQRPVEDTRPVLDVVVDRDPPVKELMIGCPVLVNSDALEPFALGWITRKQYSPFRVEVEASDGSSSWYGKEFVRTMVSPWSRGESSKRSDQLQARRRRKKGYVELTPHGVLRVSFVQLNA